MNHSRELRGFGSVGIGGAHHTGIEYRIFIRDNGKDEPDAVGIIAGEEEAIRQIAEADAAFLSLETGEELTIVVSLHSTGLGLADVQVRGPLPSFGGPER